MLMLCLPCLRGKSSSITLDFCQKPSFRTDPRWYIPPPTVMPQSFRSYSLWLNTRQIAFWWYMMSIATWGETLYFREPICYTHENSNLRFSHILGSHLVIPKTMHYSNFKNFSISGFPTLQHENSVPKMFCNLDLRFAFITSELWPYK